MAKTRMICAIWPGQYMDIATGGNYDASLMKCWDGTSLVVSEATTKKDRKMEANQSLQQTEYRR